jgi:hypothetical protein
MSAAGEGIIPGDPRYDIEERDGRWAVVNADGDVVSEHDLKVNAMAERQRLLESEDPQQGAYPDNVGS